MAVSVSNPGIPDDEPLIDWPSEIDRSESWIRRLLQSRVGHVDAVDDVFQEIAVAVLKQQARPTNPDKVSAWLKSVAIRQSAEFLRRKGRRERLEDGYASDQSVILGTAPSPRDWVMRAERSQWVQTALNALADDDREILTFKYTEKLCYREMAKRLDVTEKAIEHRLLRARKALRSQLAQHSFTDGNHES